MDHLVVFIKVMVKDPFFVYSGFASLRSQGWGPGLGFWLMHIAPAQLSLEFRGKERRKGRFGFSLLKLITTDRGFWDRKHLRQH